jgi:hypothetical protein
MSDKKQPSNKSVEVNKSVEGKRIPLPSYETHSINGKRIIPPEPPKSK